MSVIVQGGMQRRDDELVLGRRILRKMADKNIEDYEYVSEEEAGQNAEGIIGGDDIFLEKNKATMED